MPLIRNGRTVADPWRRMASDRAPPAGVPLIVDPDQWRCSRQALLGRGAPLGLWLDSDQPPELVAADLAHFDLICLHFPKFTDGRPYSAARLLRERYGYAGELRAVGDVLRDQLVFMRRCGFDAFEIADADADAAWHRAMREISVRYQQAADGSPPAAAIRHRPRPAAPEAAEDSRAA